MCILNVEPKCMASIYGVISCNTNRVLCQEAGWATHVLTLINKD